MTDIRSAATITAQIDSINKNAEATGGKVSGAELLLLELELKAANAIEKFTTAVAKSANSERYATIAAGDKVSFEFGRGDKRRVLSGTVVGSDTDNLAIQIGEGLDAQIVKVLRTAVQFPEG